MSKALRRKAPLLQQELVNADKKMADLEQKLRLYRGLYKTASGENKELIAQLNLKAAFDSASPILIGAPKSAKRETDAGREATAVALLSDWHVGARVDSRKVMGLNKFNPSVAEQRAKAYFRNLLSEVNAERSRIRIDNLLLWLGGDLISNEIHEELLETNYMTPIQETIFAEQLIDGGLEFLANHGKFKSITVVCNSGNHGRCQDGKTEILTPDGWVNISNIKVGDLVASYDRETQQHEFVPAIDVCSFISNHRFEVSSNFSNEVVSPGHNLYYNGELIPVENVPQSFKQGLFVYTAKSQPKQYDTNMINQFKLMTWIVTDGTLVDRLNTKEGVNASRVQFKFKKARKIQALSNLLGEMKIEFTQRKSGDATVICIYGDKAKEIVRFWFSGEKQFPTYFRALKGEALRAVLGVIQITDGTLRNRHVEWSSINLSNVEIIQQACVLDGIPCKVHPIQRKSGFGNKVLYISQFYPDGLSNRSQDQRGTIKRVDEPTRFYGVTTPLGTLITRREGKVSLTGNTTKKIRVSTQAENSYEYSIYKHLQGKYSDKLFQWKIADGYHAIAKIYGKGHLFHHGHAIRYQGGVGGVTVPLLRYIHRINTVFPYPIVHHWLGHFHQLLEHPAFTINGSLIGYDSYAMANGFGYEAPRQALRLIDNRRSFTISKPIYLD